MNDVIWYIGGSNVGTDLDTVYNYNYMTDSWTLTPVKLQTGLAAAKGLAAMDGLVYVTGGGDYATSSGGVNASCYMNLLGNNFVSIPNMGTARKYHMMAESSDGRIIVLGGFKPVGFGYAATTSVESLKIATTSLTLSASSIGTGEKLTASLNLVYTYSNIERLAGNIKLVDASNNVYDLGTFSGSMGPKISREVSIPQNITPGTYRFVMYDIEGYTGNLLMGDAFPVFQTNVEVTALPSVEDSLATLEQMNDDLNGELQNVTAEINATKARLAVLEQQNEDLSADIQDVQAQLTEMQNALNQKNDQKLDSTIGYLIMVLVIVILVVVILQFFMFMRKKT
jgi:chaperonin cofactor prefoldin